MRRKGVSLHGALMDNGAAGRRFPYDGQLLVSHQDALLLGGKVQAPPGYADHVVFLYPELCERCGTKICIELCSGQAITPGENGVPAFDREKCVHCGACLLELRAPHPGQPGAHEHRLPRRHRRIALGGELRPQRVIAAKRRKSRKTQQRPSPKSDAPFVPFHRYGTWRRTVTTAESAICSLNSLN